MERVPNRVILYGEYDAKTKTLYSKNDEPRLLDMVDKTVAVKFLPEGMPPPLFEWPVVKDIVKIESVSVNKDGLSVTFTTEGINAVGSYAKNYVKGSLNKLKSGKYTISIKPLDGWSSMPPESKPYLLSSIPLEMKVERIGGVERVVVDPAEERLLTYDAKENSVGSISTSKVMEEVEKMLAQGKPIKLLTEMKDGSQLKSKIISLEKDHDNGYIVNIQGNKKTLNYINNENINTALSWSWDGGYDDGLDILPIWTNPWMWGDRDPPRPIPDNIIERRDGCTHFDQLCTCSNNGWFGHCGVRNGVALCNCDFR